VVIPLCASLCSSTAQHAQRHHCPFSSPAFVSAHSLERAVKSVKCWSVAQFNILRSRKLNNVAFEVEGGQSIWRTLKRHARAPSARTDARARSTGSGGTVKSTGTRSRCNSHRNGLWATLLSPLRSYFTLSPNSQNNFTSHDRGGGGLCNRLSSATDWHRCRERERESFENRGIATGKWTTFVCLTNKSDFLVACM
jgi:hypothetical protein